MDLAFVESLIRALDESSLDSLELDRGGTRIRLSKSPSGLSPAQQVLPPAPAPRAEPIPVAQPEGEADYSGAEPEEKGQDNLLEIISPMVGTFYSSPAPDAAPYVQVGQPVGEGTVLCIIEAMKLMNELESEIEGTVAKVLVDNAQPVEYGQVLFLIDPS